MVLEKKSSAEYEERVAELREEFVAVFLNLVAKLQSLGSCGRGKVFAG